MSVAGCASAVAHHRVTPVTAPLATLTSASPTLTPTPLSSRRPTPRPVHSTPRPVPSSASAVVRTTSHPAPPPPTGLPLAQPTGNANQVITVVAPYAGSTTATLQAWQRAGTGWARRGSSMTAHVGTQGLTYHMSESVSATPIGSFTLTEAFGHNSNPGTPLPYTQTTPADWWISQPSPLYNTRQRCSANCSFTLGAPNEHLYTSIPYYNYAVVIDYNMIHPVPGAGSAVFLHVTDGNPTAGCVAIPQDSLVSIMQWLTPAAHPRILIGFAP